MKKNISPIIKEIEHETGCKVVSYKAKEREFNDTSLGLPKPGMNYAQVIVPGYILNVKIECASGEEFDKVYHSNLEGSILREKI